jgi:hypothetical protein
VGVAEDRADECLEPVPRRVLRIGMEQANGLAQLG